MLTIHDEREKPKMVKFSEVDIGDIFINNENSFCIKLPYFFSAGEAINTFNLKWKQLEYSFENEMVELVESTLTIHKNMDK